MSSYLIHLTVITRSKKNRITPTGDHTYEIHLKAKPEHNQANQLLLQALAEYFTQPTTSFKIIRGHHSRHKYVEVSPSEQK